jgi:SAM-dependent methyltransferase
VERVIERMAALQDVGGRARLRERMRLHFGRLAPSYREVRETDVEPIEYIGRRLAGRASILAADIGCGAGRYDRLLFEHLPGLRLTCVDQAPAMLEQAAALLRASGSSDFECLNSSLDDLTLPARAFDCVFTFNAVHHFDLAQFLDKASRGLRDGGRLFVYTRLPRQNARTIWGRYFPRFRERESRLYSPDQLDTAVSGCDGLFLEAVTCFRYRPVSSLERLREQARTRHYSTFMFYESTEFETCLREFERRIRADFPDPDHVTWYDENVLLEAIEARQLGKPDGPRG